jgi:hypothetical protein
MRLAETLSLGKKFRSGEAAVMGPLVNRSVIVAVKKLTLENGERIAIF